MRAALSTAVCFAVMAFLPHGQQSSGSFPVSAPSAYTGQCSSEADLLAMPVNTFCEVPGTDAYQVRPIPPVLDGTPAEFPFLYIMRAYSGAAYDYVNNVMIVRGGGHFNYGGNEILKFDVPTLSWSRPWGPSADEDIPYTPNALYDEYLDGSSGSKHTYVGMYFDPGRNALYEFGGSQWTLGGGSSSYWEFDFDTDTWTKVQTGVIGAVSGTSVVHIPTIDQVMVLAPSDPVKLYDPDTNAITTLTPTMPGNSATYQRVGIWDADDQTVVLMGATQLHLLTTDGFTGTLNDVGGSATGCEDVMVTPTGIGGPLARGGDYNPTTGNTVFYVGSGATSLWEYDIATNSCTEIPVSASNLYTPPASGAGTYYTNGLYGRFRCIQSGTLTGWCLFVEGVNENVTFYRLY